MIPVEHLAEHLVDFVDAAAEDPRLATTHLSLYLSLFRMWMGKGGVDPLPIHRSEVMRMAKISGAATYHRCIRELDAYGYIRYCPSFHPNCHTRVFLVVRKRSVG
jgi:hypothetical protein